MKKRYYVAYGSNLNIEQMQWRCPGAKAIGISEICDYQLLFKGSKTGSYLTIEKKNGSKVPVAVWRVTRQDELLLDRYEGFPDFYYKKEMILPVWRYDTGKAERRQCFVYIMHEYRKIGMPTEYYVDTCMEGYDAFGFDDRYLLSALEISRQSTAHLA